MSFAIECTKAVGTTFGTYCVADFLSNFIQHPTQKVRVKKVKMVKKVKFALSFPDVGL